MPSVRTQSIDARPRQLLTAPRSARAARALAPEPARPNAAAEYLLWLGAGLVALPAIAALALAEGLRAVVPHRRRPA